jgi:murein DD-endopeptidase MepM/ murein hydrolase activator NlpD
MSLFDTLKTTVAQVAPTLAGFKREDITGFANWFNDPEIEAKAKEIDDQRVAALREIAPDALPPEYDWPVRDRPPRVTSGFGPRILHIQGKKIHNYHIGVDFGAGEGAPILAPEDMIIKKILTPDPKYPVRFTWDHKARTWKNTAPKGRAWTPYVKAVGKHSGVFYAFKHVRARKGLKAGQEIALGEEFCVAGNLGYSMGSHLHFEIWPYRDKKVQTKNHGLTHWPNPVDPVKWLNARVKDNNRLG